MSIDMDSNILNMKVSADLTIGLFVMLDHENALEIVSARTWTIYYYDEKGGELGHEDIRFEDMNTLGVAHTVKEMYMQGDLDIPGGKEKEAAEMGFNFLDQHLPYGWRDRNWDDLDIDECDKCVLGILFMDYDYGSRILQELHGLNESDHGQYGFISGGMDPYKLNKEWLKLL